jgi:uncharacterized protein Yka (UPF0111/DUF47 family)
MICQKEVIQVKQSGMSWRNNMRKRNLNALFSPDERSQLLSLYNEAPESTPRA